MGSKIGSSFSAAHLSDNPSEFLQHGHDKRSDTLCVHTVHNSLSRVSGVLNLISRNTQMIARCVIAKVKLK